MKVLSHQRIQSLFAAACALTLSFSVFAQGAPGTPPAEGLLLWLDARDASTLTLSDTHIAGWKSKAPATARLESTGSQQPKYCPASDANPRPVVRFDGQDDVLRSESFAQHFDRWTLVVLAAPFSGGGGLCSACPAGSHDYDPGFTVDLYQSGARFDQVSVEGAGRIGGQQDQMIQDFAYGGLHLILVERDDHEIRIFLDGKAQTARPVNPAATLAEELRLGARFYAGEERNYFDGDIAEVLLYNRMLRAEERTAIEAALAATLEEQRKGEEQLLAMKEERKKNRMIAPKTLQEWPSIAQYEAAKRDQAFLPIARLPIRTDLREAIALCVRHLNSLYDADLDEEPFFFSNLRVDGAGEMHHSVNIGIPHVVGRCLVGCMAAEQAAGVPFPEPGLSILTRYLKISFDNPNHLNSYYDPQQENKRFIEFHNMREGLYGLWALIAGRQDSWARETARLMLETLDNMTDDAGHWSVEMAEKIGMNGICQSVATPNAARMVDPLLAYYRATGDPLAMKLAGAYARAGFQTLFEADGHFAPMDRSSGHVHSITSALSGITDYAIETKDATLLEGCRRVMDTGVPRYFSSWGWGDEVFPEHPANVVSRGEINQTGDIIRTALLLGDAGYPAYYETAERFLRSMLLPTQHREAELKQFMHENEHPRSDAEREVLKRTVGGFAMQLPNDRMRKGDWPLSTLDITSGAVHALSECWRHRVTAKGDASFVNLLFDYEDDRLQVKSGLPQEGRIAFAARKPGAVAIRIPAWVNPASIALTINGQAAPVAIEQSYLRVESRQAGAQGVLTFEVPCKVERETVDGIVYTTTWIGNQIIEILPRGLVSPLPF